MVRPIASSAMSLGTKPRSTKTSTKPRLDSRNRSNRACSCPHTSTVAKSAGNTVGQMRTTQPGRSSQSSCWTDGAAGFWFEFGERVSFVLHRFLVLR